MAGYDTSEQNAFRMSVSYRPSRAMGIGNGLALRRPASRLFLVFVALLLCSTSHAAAQVAVRDCEDLYFGYGGAPDLEAAYACLQAELDEGAPRDPLGVYAPMVLMRLNGRGVPVDLKEASRLLSAWRNVEPRASEQRLYLQRVVLERQSGLGATDPSPIEFCALPADAPFEARCAEIRKRRREGERERALRGLMEHVPEAARPSLRGLIFAFDGYVDQELERSARAQALRDSTEVVAAQHARVQSHFDEVVREVLVERELSEASRADVSRKEGALDRAFEADRTERRAAFVAYEKALPDSAARYARFRREYDQAARQSQAAWRRYRDAWVVAARLGAAESSKADAAEAAVRILLVEQRMTELQPE